MPKYNETLDRLNVFGTKLRDDANLNLDTEIATLKSDIQAIWDQP
jgi:hypothetical protein